MIDFQKEYPPPTLYKRPDGSARYAFMTFVIRNDSFLPGALVFAYALRQLHTQADLVCMVTKDISEPARLAMEKLFDRVVEVQEIYIAHQRRQERQDRPFLFTRFQALQAGTDGALHLGYEKIALADADVLPLCCYDHLFTLEAPAGILNEAKANCMEYDSDGKYIIPATVAEYGKWNWHRLYDPLCPHGAKIPAEITNRVSTDMENMGINSSLWVLEPSQEEYEHLLAEANKPEMSTLIGSKFNWPEMQFASVYWSGKWTSIDLRFSSFNGYPQLDVLCGTHFAGFKPWKFKEPGTFARFSRFPDYKQWQHHYMEMMDKYPQLHQLTRLTRLENEIRSLTKH